MFHLLNLPILNLHETLLQAFPSAVTVSQNPEVGAVPLNSGVSLPVMAST